MEGRSGQMGIDGGGESKVVHGLFAEQMLVYIVSEGKGV